MRYLKISVLSGIALFAVAMFFLSQTIQGFLNPDRQAEQLASEAELDPTLSEPAPFPDLNLDFPAGALPKENGDSNPAQTDSPPALAAPASDQSQTPIKLATASQSTPGQSPGLNFLLLSQATEEQKTLLIEELLRLDADLVRKMALNQNPQSEPQVQISSVQQTALTNTASTQTVVAGYSQLQRNPQTGQPEKTLLVFKDKPTQIIASYRGATLKTQATALENGSLHQKVQVVPLHTSQPFSATVLSNELAAVNLPRELPTPQIKQSAPSVKLSQMGEFQPAEIIKLSGEGLVVGLNGTGDRNFSAEAIRALKSSMASMKINLQDIKTPLQAGNLANVTITAYIPSQGVTRGQRIECYVNAVNPEVNLSGGYLLPTAVHVAGTKNPQADALVVGALQTDQTQNKSQALIENGAQILSSLSPRLVTGQGIPHLKFFLNAAIYDPRTGQLVVNQINRFLAAHKVNTYKAILESSGLIMISLPDPHPQRARQLASQILTVEIPQQSDAQSGQPPEVFVDLKSAQIQTRGTVLLQPARLSFPELMLEIAPPANSGATRLQDLLALLQQLQMPQPQQIQLLRSLQQQGKINAAYREQ